MSFFKAYDMRGTFGRDFTLADVEAIGRELPRIVPGSRWLVGRDMRTTSSDVRDALVSGLRDAGVEITDIGLATTPMVYFFTATDKFDGSVMVTASHNPPSDNGLKVSKRTALPVGFKDGLNEIEKTLIAPRDNRDNELAPRDNRDNKIAPRDNRDNIIAYRECYREWMKARLPNLSRVKIAIDCSNGMSSLFVRELFPKAIIINEELDGNFPAHSPNPLKADARDQLAKVVRDEKCDVGVIFDGDADRAMFVDENGDFVQPDYLIPIIARATSRFANRDKKATKIIHDVRTSRGATETLKEDGFIPVMVPVGHAFAKPILREEKALCGGELAGHYYFEEFFGCDSGLLAAMRVLGEVAIAKKSGKTFSEMMKPICSRYANSGEMNFRVENKDLAIERVLAIAKDFGNEESRTTIDGVRIDYREGWINIRKSNTEPYLRLIVECDSSERLAIWVAKLKNAIEEKIS